MCKLTELSPAVEPPQPEKMPPRSVSPLKVQQRAEHCNTSGVDNGHCLLSIAKPGSD